MIPFLIDLNVCLATAHAHEDREMLSWTAFDGARFLTFGKKPRPL
jgi:hypothetical protein